MCWLIGSLIGLFISLAYLKILKYYNNYDKH